MNIISREQRILKMIKGEDIDYLPSQITFADRSRYKLISEALGLASENELDDYLENHFYFSFTRHDKTMIFRDVKEEIEKLKIDGYAFPDWENKVVYDAWGIGYKVGVGSFFVCSHPLQKLKSNDINVEILPPEIKDAIFSETIEDAVKKYKTPDINMKNNFLDWENDLNMYANHFMVLPSGYAGIYERAYHILGFEELMLYIALKPKLVEELLDKITDYKIEIAKKTVEMGFKIAHTGDDLGTQHGGFFSMEVFKNIILPRIKRHWEVFNKAGLPIMLHSCGDITKYIPSLIDIGLRILEPVQPVMDLKYLKKEYGKDLIFFGGINTQKLPFLSPEEVATLTRDTIRILGKGGGYVIAPSQEIMNDVPIENIKALLETIKRERNNF